MDLENCFYGVFFYAFKYTSNYLFFTITLLAASLIGLWLIEKPQFYKLIFKRSKHSFFSLVGSNDVVMDEETQNIASFPETQYNEIESKDQLNIKDASDCIK